jgi:F0F1-type ATP synthase membrane subunit a
MSLDLFSSIDFFLRKFSFLRRITFILSLFGVIIFFKRKISFNRKISFLRALNNILLQNFSKSLKKKVGSLLFLLTLFYFIFMRNLLGLFPFAFG